MGQSNRIQVVSGSPEETQEIGIVLGTHAGPGDLFLLTGDLGTGKTCLAQGILWGLGGDEYARSPTFVLVSQYRGRLTMNHIDLYRIDSADEIVDLGLDDYLLDEGISVVEWADKAAGLLPEHHLGVLIEYLGETTRRITLTATNHRYSPAISAVASSAAMSQ